MILNQNTIAKVFTGFIFITASTLTLSSCYERRIDDVKEDSKEEAMEKNEEELDTREKLDEVSEMNEMDDAKFLVNVSEINMEEIDLGKLAQINSQNATVKDLGKMMENAHIKAQFELKSLADKKKISIPTTATQNIKDAHEELSMKTGDSFDRAYTDKMVEGHKKAIAKFEYAVNGGCKDADVKAWATNTLPALRKHLEHALMAQGEISKKKN